MRLCVVGAGYVGLVTGACFADFGHSVVCVDADRRKIASLKNGRVPIHEPGLDALVGVNIEADRLSFSDDLTASVEGADGVFLAVGTPSRRSDGWPDLTSIFAVVRDAAPYLTDDALVVIKSTVPIGTGDDVERILRDARPESDIRVVSNPEFLRAGSAVRDFKRPDRVVVGAEDAFAHDMMMEIYAPLIARNIPVLHTSRRSAELIKYTSNALLATKIAFINEVAELCERANADVREVAHGVGLDGRIGAKFLEAGPGFGGSCFRKDALALAQMGERHETPMRIAEAVLHSNEARKRALVRKVTAAIGKPLRATTIGVLGLTFKANTDDMRDAPSIALIHALIEGGAQVRAYDPAGMDAARSVLPGEVTYTETAYDVCDRADALVIMTEWPQFRGLDLGSIAIRLKSPVIVDLRNLCDSKAVMAHGMDYHAVGRAPLRAGASGSAPAKSVTKLSPKTNGSRHAPHRGRADIIEPSAKWTLARANATETNGRGGV
jgi:UDPglucose 6-dehydrogenase